MVAPSIGLGAAACARAPEAESPIIGNICFHFFWGGFGGLQPCPGPLEVKVPKGGRISKRARAGLYVKVGGGEYTWAVAIWAQGCTCVFPTHPSLWQIRSCTVLWRAGGCSKHRLGSGRLRPSSRSMNEVMRSHPSSENLLPYFLGGGIGGLQPCPGPLEV